MQKLAHVKIDGDTIHVLARKGKSDRACSLKIRKKGKDGIFLPIASAVLGSGTPETAALLKGLRGGQSILVECDPIFVG